MQWGIPGPTYEIRTIFFNWPKDGMVYDMFVKDMSKFRHLVNDDFGLRAQYGDAHLPQFSWSENMKNIPPVPKHLHLPTFHHTNVHNPRAHFAHAHPPEKQQIPHDIEGRELRKEEPKPPSELLRHRVLDPKVKARESPCHHGELV